MTEPRRAVSPDQLGIGDMILVRGGGFAGWVIRAVTRSKWAHVAVVVKRGDDGRWIGIEAAPGGMRWVDAGKISEMLRHPDTISNCGQPKTDEQRYALAVAMEALIGKRYDYPSVVFSGLAYLRLVKLPLAWRGNPAAFDCSNVYDYVAEHVGLETPDADQTCSPAHWGALCLARGWDRC